MRDFIEEKSPQAAAKIAKQLKESIKSLCQQPEMGVQVEGFCNVRDLLAKSYIVRYLVEEETVTILRVWHGKEFRI